MQKRLTLGLVALLAASGCNCGEGAIRVVVHYEGFRPGCLEVVASDAAGGESERVQLEGVKVPSGQALIGVVPPAGWSRDVNLRVRSFERTCEGPVLEEVARESPLAVEPAVVGEWVVSLSAVDSDGDGFATRTPAASGTDCDDTAPTIHPGAEEACGASDTNCDGLAGCLDPLCSGKSCDDGVAGTTLDVCRGDGGCSGTPFTDCPAGTWVTAAGTPTADRGCTPCPGGSWSGTLNAANCTPWSNCMPGQYVNGSPSSTADRTCTACAAGFYTSVSNSSGCAAVGTCAPGTTQSVPASMTSPVQCAACAAGNYCAGGMTAAVPCPAGTWDDDGNSASVCVAWSSCAPGFAETAPGSATSNRVCSPCAAGTFCSGGVPVPCPSGTWDHDANAATACVAWTSCAIGFAEATPPSATADRSCSACAAGSFCAGGPAAAVPCATGTWDHDASAATACVAWTQCSPGFFVNAPGSTTGDRTCSPCAAGTFSATTDATSCAPWTDCVAGQYVSTAGSAAANQGCTACSTGFTTTSNASSCTAWSSCTADTWESTAPTATSNRVCSNYTSCLDRLTRAPGSTSGSYLIDADGAGAGVPFTVTCDMTTAGGGWTVISFEDFSSSAAGWTDSRRDTTSSCFTAWGAMLGGSNLFGSGATSSKTYSLLGVAHTQVRVALDFIVIDSWDTENARVSVDAALLYDSPFTFGGTNVCGGIWGDRGAQAVVLTPAHLANTVMVTVTSTLNQAATDESFGVDNVSIMIR